MNFFSFFSSEDFACFVVGNIGTLDSSKVEFIFREEIFSLIWKSLNFFFNFVKTEEFFFRKSAEGLEIINLLFKVTAVLEGSDVVRIVFE